MCDFHSILGIALGDNYEIRHDPSNSHSGMAGQLENKPNRQCVIFEAEWDCDGELPSDSRLIRNIGECPERLVKKIRDHYIKVKEAIETGKHLDGYFSDVKKWADVWRRVKTLPKGFYLSKMSGSLDLSGLTSLPDGVTFPKECGSLDLRGLTSLPDGVTFPKECGSLYLRGDLKQKVANKK